MAKSVASLDLAREIEKLVELEVLRTHLLTSVATSELLSRLTQHPDAVCARLAAKLTTQLSARHTIACDVSDRHDGLGYSRQAIEKHFMDALEHELVLLLAPLENTPCVPRTEVTPPGKRHAVQFDGCVE